MRKKEKQAWSIFQTIFRGKTDFPHNFFSMSMKILRKQIFCRNCAKNETQKGV
jgi:hypothetical protein